jgi:disulfide bond formation protein DsbB
MNDILARAGKDPAIAAALVSLVGLATIAGFFFFQYVMHLPPCPLCLQERDAFYVSVPLAALLWLGAGHGATRKVMLLGFLVIAAVMLWNAGLAAYHAGVEWKFWPGPQDCSGPIDSFGSAKNLLKSLNHISLVRCDQAAWRFLGLSLAGWDVLVSLGLVVAALFGAKAAYLRTEKEA